MVASTIARRGGAVTSASWGRATVSVGPVRGLRDWEIEKIAERYVAGQGATLRIRSGAQNETVFTADSRDPEGRGTEHATVSRSTDHRILSSCGSHVGTTGTKSVCRVLLRSGPCQGMLPGFTVQSPSGVDLRPVSGKTNPSTGVRRGAGSVDSGKDHVRRSRLVRSSSVVCLREA